MSAYPISKAPSLPTITTMSECSLGGVWLPLSGSGAIGINTSSAVNLIRAMPFHIGQTIIVQKMFMLNGATVAGNLDIGVFSIDGTKLASTGSFAQAGTNALQAVALPTPLTLYSGQYYMAFASDNASATFQGTSVSAIAGTYTVMAGVANATNFPLPANLTLSANGGVAAAIFGLSTVQIV